MLAGCAAAAGDEAALKVRLRPLTITADTPADRSVGVRIGELEFLAAYALEGSSRTFGGLSALLLDREFLLLLSDRGHLFRARRVEDAATGRLTALADWRELPLPAAARKADTEALALLPDGSVVIGAEGGRRLFRLGPDGKPTTPLVLPDFLQNLPGNEGVEALATLPGGALLAVSEGAYMGSGLVVAGRLDGKEAIRLAVAAPDRFRPTGADAAGGMLFLLQRRLSLLGGLQARIVAVPLDRFAHPREAMEIDGRELARLGADSFAENFEGIAVRRAADGRYLVYLVADDNFSALQRTLLLQLAWRPPDVASVDH